MNGFFDDPVNGSLDPLAPFGPSAMDSDAYDAGTLEVFKECFPHETAHVDANGDGTPDGVVTAFDTDGDGVADYMHVLDASGKAVEGFDQNGDGLPDLVNVDLHSAGPNLLGDGGDAHEALLGYGRFDPYGATDVIGDPLNDMEHWHVQETDHTCAVCAQEFMLESLTGLDFSEGQMRELAYALGATTDGGTPLESCDAVLNHFGIETEKVHGGTLDDLERELSSGNKILAGVDADEIWNPGRDWVADELVGDRIGYWGSDSNHAVQVIGIDRSDPENPMVILNDSGTPDGCGLTVPADEFLDAWDDSGNFMVVAKPPAGGAGATASAWTHPWA
jgi:hypothetical protein